MQTHSYALELKWISSLCPQSLWEQEGKPRSFPAEEAEYIPLPSGMGGNPELANINIAFE